MSAIETQGTETVRPASTLELFFDLVYVFAITQVARVFHDQPTFPGLARGLLLLFLMWWTWSLYTWTTNWTGTSSLPIRLFLIAAMGATLMMSLSVPTAFGDGAVWFGVSYFMVRVLAGALYWTGARNHRPPREALLTFLPISLAGAGLVLAGGALGARWTGAFWMAAVAVDALSAATAGRGTWAVDAHHFAERNGLFVIIALGETIVAIGLSAAEVPRDLIHMGALGVAFAGAAALWWSYFASVAPFAEETFIATRGKARGRFARDVYTILHFPLVVGIVLFAVAAEETVLHPGTPLLAAWRVAMAVGASLVMLAVVAGTYRAAKRVPKERLLAALTLILLVWVAADLNAVSFATLVVSTLAITLLVERKGDKPAFEAGRPPVEG